MIIYIVRHGEHQKVDGLNYLERAELGLTNLGRKQIEATARHLKHLGVEKVFSSTLRRAQESAEIIASSCAIPVVYDDRLNEEIASRSLRDPALIKEIRKKIRQNHEFLPEDGESFNQSSSRFISTLQDIVSSGVKSVCAVSHREIFQNALVKLFSFREVPPIHEAAISAIEYDGRNFRAGYINKTVFSLPLFMEKIKRKVYPVRSF